MVEINPNAGFREHVIREYPDKSERYLEYRRKWAENPSKGIVEEFPLNIDIELARSCNLDCPFCYRRHMKKEEKSGLMDSVLAKKIIDEGAKYHCPAIKWNWYGESTLHPDLPELVKYAKSLGYIDLLINTNGTLLNEDLALKLIDAGMTKIIFSVDSIDPEIYEKCRVGAKFGTVYGNIRRLVMMRGSERLPYIRVQKVDLPELRDEPYFEFWKTQGADAVGIDIYKEKDPKKIQTALCPKNCAMPFQRLSVDFLGNIRACCGDNKNEYLLGNVKDTTMHDAWHSEKILFLRMASLKGKMEKFEHCRKCDLG